MAESNTQWKRVIIEQMLDGIAKNGITKVYTEDKNLKKLIENLGKIDLVDNCNDATCVLASLPKNEKCKKPEIVFNYQNYKANKNAVGVFFWQKGRPTILFSQKRLKKFNIKIRGEVAKFVSP